MMGDGRMVIECISNVLLDNGGSWLKSADMRSVSRELWKITPVRKMMFRPGKTPLDIFEKYHLDLQDLRVGTVLPRELPAAYDLADLINRCTGLYRLECNIDTFRRVDLQRLPLLRSLHIIRNLDQDPFFDAWSVQGACDVEVLTCNWYQRVQEDGLHTVVHTVVEKFPKLRRLTIFGIHHDKPVDLQPLRALKALGCVKLMLPFDPYKRNPMVVLEDLPFVVEIE